MLMSIMCARQLMLEVYFALKFSFRYAISSVNDLPPLGLQRTLNREVLGFLVALF